MSNERLEEIRAARLAKRELLIARGHVPYPAEARRSHTLQLVHADFANLQKEGTAITVTGRVTAIRQHGGLAFLDLTDASGKLQLQISRDTHTDAFANLEFLDTGDFIQAAGSATTTKRGQQTLAVTEWHLLSKSIRPLPSTWYGLKDHESRFRQREVDLQLNSHARHTLAVRANIISWLRQHLATAGYMEFETPILQPLAGGATAAPFITHHNALDIDLYLRIAPELYLKRLLVAGYEKVFEIGRNFRNEGIDREHNPEFTMLELYWAYADYEDLMDFTEHIITTLVQDTFDSEEVSYRDTTLSFATPWQRVRFVEAVSAACDLDILRDKDPDTLAEIFAERGIELPAIKTYAKMVDSLYKALIRPKLTQPTLLYDYPAELAPLAKRTASDPRLVEKFQLLVGGTEIINAYTELNDPVEQQQRFEEQQAAHEAGDEEAQAIDHSYLRALEYGMPPAAGWGLGIDRLVALLTNAPTLRDTIAFPLLKPEQK